MLYVFPFLTWLAAIASAVLLVVSWNLGEMRRSSFAALILWFLLAGYCQFFGSSPIVGAAGLLLQTLLAIYLSVRFRLSG